MQLFILVVVIFAILGIGGTFAGAVVAAFWWVIIPVVIAIIIVEATGI